MPTDPSSGRNARLGANADARRSGRGACVDCVRLAGRLGDPWFQLRLIVFLKLDRSDDPPSPGSMSAWGTRCIPAAPGRRSATWRGANGTIPLGSNSSLALHRDWIDRLVLPVLELDSINPVTRWSIRRCLLADTGGRGWRPSVNRPSGGDIRGLRLGERRWRTIERPCWLRGKRRPPMARRGGWPSTS